MDIVKLIPGKCKYILKKGQNSGFQCSCNEKSFGYCTRHYNIINKKELEKNSNSSSNSNSSNNSNNSNSNNSISNNSNTIEVI